MECPYTSIDNSNENDMNLEIQSLEYNFDNILSVDDEFEDEILQYLCSKTQYQKNI